MGKYPTYLETPKYQREKKEVRQKRASVSKGYDPRLIYAFVVPLIEGQVEYEPGLTEGWEGVPLFEEIARAEWLLSASNFHEVHINAPGGRHQWWPGGVSFDGRLIRLNGVPNHVGGLKLRLYLTGCRERHRTRLQTIKIAHLSLLKNRWQGVARRAGK